MTFFKNNWSMRWVLAGLLLGFGFIYSSFWIFSFIGVMLVIHLSLQQVPIKQIMLGGLTAWTIKSAAALIWFWTVYPMDWINIDLGYWQLPIIFVWWSTASLWLGFGGILFAVTCRVLLTYTSRAVAYLVIPFLWIFAEMAGSLVFSIITIGPGGSITSAFSFGYIGYLLANHDLLLNGARIYGVYSLGVILVALVATLHWIIVQTKYKKYGYVCLFIIFITNFVSLPVSSDADRETYQIAVVDTDFGLKELRSQLGRKEMQTQLEEAVQAGLGFYPDYLVLPEDSRYFDHQQDTHIVAAQFSFLNSQSEVIVVDSGKADDDERSVIESFIYNGKEKKVEQSHKRYLVPQGEFMPMLYAGALKLFGNDQIVDQFGLTVASEIGSKTSQQGQSASSPGVLFCFESVSPWGVKTVMEERGSVPFIAHPVSHSWFNQPESLWGQLTNMLQVQAVWNQQYIVSAGNGVDSQIFAPTGRVQYPEVSLSGKEWDVRLVEIPK